MLRYAAPRTIARLLAGTLVLAAMGSAAVHAQVARLERQDITDAYVMMRAHQYNYVPDVIFDGHAFHLYWCASVSGAPGDHVLHAVSATLDGPFHASNDPRANTFDISLAPSGLAGAFDGEHVCDPTVIRAGSTYLMYFDGAALRAHGTGTAIGLASSRDGVHFSRLNGGAPIVRPANTSAKPANAYGAGQPAVFKKDGSYYLTFSDSTGAGANPVSGAGQFLLRSADPTFARDISELTARGWAKREAGRHTAEHAWLEAFGVDTAYDTRSGKLLVASDQDKAATWVYVVDPTDFHSLGHVAIAGTWRDGPSIAKSAEHTVLPRDSCTTLALSVFKGDSRDTAHFNDVTTWNIALSRGTVRLADRLCAH